MRKLRIERRSTGKCRTAWWNPDIALEATEMHDEIKLVFFNRWHTRWLRVPNSTRPNRGYL